MITYHENGNIISQFNKRYGHTAHNLMCLMLNVIIWERFIFIRSGFPMTDNNTFLAVFQTDLITQQQKQLNRFVKFHVFYSVSCFLCELPLVLGVWEKVKKTARYLQENPRYLIWTRSVDWFSLYNRRRTDGQTDRQTHTHTQTHTHIHFF